MDDRTIDIYSIKKIKNGYIVAINEEALIETCDYDYITAVSRLTTHLVNKIHVEEKK